MGGASEDPRAAIKTVRDVPITGLQRPLWQGTAVITESAGLREEPSTYCYPHLSRTVFPHLTTSSPHCRECRLAERANLFESAFERSPTAMTITGLDGRFTRVNAAYAQLVGYDDPADLTGVHFAAVTHPDDAERTTDAAARMLTSGEAYQTEKRYVRRDGRIVHVLLSSTLVHDARGGPALLFTQAHDITARRIAEESRAQLAAVVRATANAVLSLDTDGAIRTWNAGAERLYGYAAAEAIGHDGAALLASDRVARQRRLARVLSTRVPEHFEGQDVRKDGSLIEVAVTDSPILDPDGRIVGIARIAEDITARRRAEVALHESVERWRMLLAQVDEIVVIVDPERCISYVSPACERWLGHAPGALVGRVYADGVLDADVPDLDAAFERAAAGDPAYVRNRVRAADGSWHFLDSRIARLDETLDGSLLIVSMDVTERVDFERERERLELERRVSQRLEAVGQLAAGIAHEINTPLQFVGDSVSFMRDAFDDLCALVNLYREALFSDDDTPVALRRERLRDAEQDAELDELFEEIPRAFARTTEGISRVRTIVHAMKRFSNATDTEFAPADLNEAIRMTLEVARNEYKYVADVEVDLGDLPYVVCNIGELNQVFLNLLVNAAHALADDVANGGRRGTITIATRVDGQHAVVRCSDNGPGIPPEIQDRIYEPFFTTKEVGRGTGQGLALARTTIDRHGGTVECISAPGEGATFTIRLPLVAAGSEPAGEPAHQPASDAASEVQ